MSVEDFEFDFTLEQVEDMLKGNSEAEEWYDAMCHVLPQYNITTEARVAAFIAQCGHESNNFKVLSENLNYSADALDKIFPKYFKNAGRHAQDYHREPEEIAKTAKIFRDAAAWLQREDGFWRDVEYYGSWQ